MFITMVEFADKFTDLIRDQADWSQATFGSDDEKGPMGSLKHLEKEARECQEAVGTPEIAEELADCFLLLLDASRRAGIKPMQLVEAAQEKMVQNKKRKWPNTKCDWTYEPAHLVDSEDCMGNKMQYWRVFATNPDWPGSSVLGSGCTPEEAYNSCKIKAAQWVDKPIEHIRNVT